MKTRILLSMLCGAMMSHAIAENLTGSGKQVPSVVYERSFTPNYPIFSSEIRDIAFSPDGQYVAILYARSSDWSFVVVWNMRTNQEQARVDGISAYAGGPAGGHFIWAKDSQSFTFSHSQENKETEVPGVERKSGMRWYSAVDGHVVRDVNIVCYGMLNKDGSKLLCMGPSGPNYLARYRIYSTADWSYQDHDLMPAVVRWFVWTNDDQVVASTIGNPRMGNLDGIVPGGWDWLLRRVDPQGRQASKTVLLPAYPDESSVNKVVIPAYINDYRINLAANKLADSAGWIVDMTKMRIITFGDPAMMAKAKTSYADCDFSPDGRFLYLLKSNQTNDSKSLILDSETGRTVSAFNASGHLLSVSPAGHQMVVALGRKVTVYNIH